MQAVDLRTEMEMNPMPRSRRTAGFDRFGIADDRQGGIFNTLSEEKPQELGAVTGAARPGIVANIDDHQRFVVRTYVPNRQRRVIERRDTTEEFLPEVPR